jgi:DegV family protein with EDD domain
MTKMANVSIITDSIACLPREMVDEYGINIIPFSLSIDGRSYRDRVDISPSQAYELFTTDPVSMFTAPASPVDYLDAFRNVGRRVREIVCVTVSARLSTAYNVARLAADQAVIDVPGLMIEVMDSRTATAAEGFIALAAARAAAAGRNMAEVVAEASAVSERIGLIALLDTVRYVYRSGRIPEIAARAGSVLGIRPLLTITDGVVRVVNMGRDKGRTIDRLLEYLRKDIGNLPVHLAVMHAYALDDAVQLKERIEKEFKYIELWLTEFSPLMGYACGTGTLGIAYYI